MNGRMGHNFLPVDKTSLFIRVTLIGGHALRITEFPTFSYFSIELNSRVNK